MVAVGGVFNYRFAAVYGGKHCLLLYEIIAHLRAEMNCNLVDVTLLVFLTDAAGDETLACRHVVPFDAVLLIGTPAVAVVAFAVELGIIGLFADNGDIDIKGKASYGRRVASPAVAAAVAGKVSVAVCVPCGLLSAAACYGTGMAVINVVYLAPFAPGVLSLRQIIAVFGYLITGKAFPVAGIALSLTVGLLGVYKL